MATGTVDRPTYRARVSSTKQRTCEVRCEHTHRVWHARIDCNEGDTNWLYKTIRSLDWETTMKAACDAVKEANFHEWEKTR